MVRPSQRREMATWAVKSKGRSIRRACELFVVSETCYRYEPKLSSENEKIVDWLVSLTHNQRNWGFGLCYLFLRNVKGFVWNHKRVYRGNQHDQQAGGQDPSFAASERSHYRALLTRAVTSKGSPIGSAVVPSGILLSIFVRKGSLRSALLNSRGSGA